MKAVVSLSGGMDSTCLVLTLLAGGYSEVKAVSFDYGQKHKVELERAAKFVQYLQGQGINITHNVVDLSSMAPLLNSTLISGGKDVPHGHYEDVTMRDTVVPNRNVIFGSIVYAAALSEAMKDGSKVDIALGVHSGDNAVYPDCRPESIEALRHAFKISNWDSHLVEYKSPFINIKKREILQEGSIACDRLGLDFMECMKNTSTCYDPTPEGKASGKSSSDIERIEAFLSLGLVDPIEYVDGWDEAVRNAKEVLGIE
jgi:7-cyano-7-deazaguanine synthase